MNPRSGKEAESLFKNITKLITPIKNVETVICAPFVFISLLKKLKSKKIKLGAQTVSSDIEGAHTGDISASQLSDTGVVYSIVGHSERRAHGETNEDIQKKIPLLLKSNITPVVCVGEISRTADGAYLETIKNQLISSLGTLSKNQISQVVIAYEPVWALSTTENRHDATPHDFEEIRIFLRKILSDVYGPTTAHRVPVVYGGSVYKENALSFLQAGADGLLIGKASLDVKQFSAIIQLASALK